MNTTLDPAPSVNFVSSARSVLNHHRSGATVDELTDTLEHLELQAEHAQTIAKDSSSLFLKAATNIASLDFFTVLNRFDTDALIKRLHEKPELYFQMINSYANLMSANLEHQKLEFKQKQAEARHREREQKIRSRKPILITNDTLAAFSRALHRTSRREQAESAPSPRWGEGRGEVPPVPARGTPNGQLSSTSSNTGCTDLMEIDAATSLQDQHPEPDVPADTWSDQAVEDLVCCPS